jgi:acetate kinase
MSDRRDALILTVNSGSSSIKTALYRVGRAEELLCRGQLERIGLEGGLFEMKDSAGRILEAGPRDLPDHAAALEVLFAWLRGRPEAGAVDAVGHRVVHGGQRYRAPERVSPEMLAELRRLAPFDPMHLPAEILAIESVARRLPELPQIACFDTAFHRTLPDVARVFALPRHLAEQGIHRYGFHGLSYEFILEELARLDGAPAAGATCEAAAQVAARGRLIIAHLGNGASMAAVRDGQGVDTTMGFTPTGGLVMSTRSGDLDPGVLLYLLTQQGLTAEQLNRLVNHDGGMLGISGVSSDMRELLAQAPANAHARLAVEVFCYQARKFIGALAAALGGLDALVFTAGIGERSAPVRERICAGLDWLGVRLDPARNAAQEAVISAPDSRVTVRVVPTNEELMIARHTHRVLGS